MISNFFLAIIFYLFFMPFGFILRLLGKDILRLKLDRKAKSYWIERKKPMGSMKNQI